MEWIKSVTLLFGLYLLCLCGEAKPSLNGNDANTLTSQRYRQACLGSNNGLHHVGVSADRYEFYKTMYTNCTYVEHNLELVFLDEIDEYDLGFLEDIEEVSGYVLIVSVFASRVPLTGLRIIRGNTLFKHDDNTYAVFMSYNFKKGSEIGLQELQFLSLSEILAGSVFFFNNNMLCYENTINWKDILSGQGATVAYHLEGDEAHRTCGQCHVNCTYTINDITDRHCWGEGPASCQRLSREVCSPQCDGRCYGPSPQECCHKECAGGCDGPLNTQCWSCRLFKNEGACVPFCPPLKIYNPEKYQTEPNPDAKYSYGSNCVEECPAHLVQSHGSCVQDCGENMTVVDKKCTECKPWPCPKQCILPRDKEFHVNANNLSLFTECTVIKGNLLIFASTFEGDPLLGTPTMHPSKLAVLETVQEVTGHVVINGQHEDFKDLTFLRNLKYIRGRELDLYQSALQISRTWLESLGLQSLVEITNGRVVIAHNTQLCFASSIDWNRLTLNRGKSGNVVTANRNASQCELHDLVCHDQCSSEGCWATGDNNCFSCAAFHLDTTCVQSCQPSMGVYDAGNATCLKCDTECKMACSGPGADQCDKCKHYKDGPFCKLECPEHKYADETATCQSCHPNCQQTCSGPLNTVGEGGCTACDLAVLDESGNVTQCLPADSRCDSRCDSSDSEIGYYMKNLNEHEATEKGITRACLRCHPECSECTGPGQTTADCQTCANLIENGICVSNCSSEFYMDSGARRCRACHMSCLGCDGPGASDCDKCRYHKIYANVEKSLEEIVEFNCTDECPEYAPNKYTNNIDGVKETMCVSPAAFDLLTGAENNTKLVVGLAVGGGILVLVVAVVFACIWKQRSKAEENKLRLTARMSGLEESEPLTPTDAKPDMATLRLIKESEMRRGNIIGSGAFGTVYKGFWIPDGETVKIPVAIKVLQEGTSPSQNKELLEEARIMASVEHPCCIRILAVCMTAQMMLITQLMPLGCLLDYVRKNKNNIGSKVLLNWCTQIARGMAYLEERLIVHRDLAARNVLVQSPGQVKITDFGLAKLLDFNEEEFHAGGGKMPIKWLALECIQHRIFTHKSDVWSFGVTIWELFTYGQRPYENIRAKDIPELLEKGERLPQPPICTIDVYMIMIKCWMLDADSRPCFKELADEFAKMARDPGRYLVIDGDKLMRLPSQPYDNRDLIRNMSIAADSPEDFRIVEADDYLQPRSVSVEVPPNGPGPLSYHIPPAIDRTPQLNGYKLDRIGEDSNNDNDRHGNSMSTNSTSAGSREGSRERDYPSALVVGVGGGCPPPQSQGRRDRKYGCLEAASAARRQRETAPQTRDSLNSRYSSDPCKVLGPGDKEGDSGLGSATGGVADEPHFPAPPTPLGHGPGGGLGGGLGGAGDQVDFPLPVDEDDYLQPKSSNPRAYMDLVDGGPDYLTSDENCNPMDRKPAYQPKDPSQPQSLYLDMSSPSRTAIDNPEYFDRTPDDPHSQAHARHPGDRGSGGAPSVNLDNLKTEKRPLRLGSMSSESEAASEHDYYNECDQLNIGKAHAVYFDPRTESRV